MRLIGRRISSTTFPGWSWPLQPQPCSGTGTDTGIDKPELDCSFLKVSIVLFYGFVLK